MFDKSKDNEEDSMESPREKEEEYPGNQKIKRNVAHFEKRTKTSVAAARQQRSNPEERDDFAKVESKEAKKKNKIMRIRPGVKEGREEPEM